MDMLSAVGALEALAHESRLSVFRLLVRAGPEGITAGAIAERLQALPNTMSSHLAKLSRAGIVTSERDGRHIIYRADFDAIGQLIVYLMEDCCDGNAEVCTPVAASIRCWQ
jgi:DNA-binding transcriptional ArsR family regulator